MRNIIQRVNCCPNTIFINPLLQMVCFIMAVLHEVYVPTQVILYTTINIYQLHKQLYMIVPHYIIFVVHVQLRGHITPPCFK